MAKLADECFERMILGRWKYPSIVRSRIDKDIKPSIGKGKAKDVNPSHMEIHRCQNGLRHSVFVQFYKRGQKPIFKINLLKLII